ncbi:hypothetical protein [Paludibaculum fermentans]|uniref:hypothetical protein n=1 Tax=Paludibaculum fermentans TaxID=1473598 RepID=UPI003EBA7D52
MKVAFMGGRAYVCVAFDVAWAINLTLCREHLGEVESEFGYRDPQRAPLVLRQECAPVILGEFATDCAVAATIYDIGSISIRYRLDLPAGVQLPQLVELSLLLADNPAIRQSAAALVAQLLQRLESRAPSAITPPRLTTAVEDYSIFRLQLEPGSGIDSLLNDSQREIAQIVKSFPSDPSSQLVHEALSGHHRWSRNADLTVIDWHAAILISDGDKAVNLIIDRVLRMLEYANVQLLNFKGMQLALESQLSSLEVSLTSGLPAKRGQQKLDALAIAYTQLFSEVQSSLEAFDNDFLERAFDTVAARFRFEKKTRDIREKLSRLETITDRLKAAEDHRRMERLEWYIIWLFVVDIILALVEFALFFLHKRP